ncbi:MAG: SDR family oxidoreductase [Pacificimonas sp.]
MPTRRQLLGAGAATAALAATATTAAHHGGSNHPDLSGKTVLITGCSSGFGFLAAQHFARCGAKVVATMRNLPRPEADALLASVADENLDIHIVEIDVLDDASATTGVAEAERLAGGAIDVLVNNAGISTSGPVEVSDMAAAELMFGTNVYGPQRMARAALPKMREKGGGVIINVTSQLGRVMYPGFGLYSGTKFALEAMSEQMAYELAPRGVEVSIVQPGGYPTEIWENAQANTRALYAREDDARLAAYPELTQLSENGGGGTTDPMDVPRAMADIAAMAPGTRPLRRPVHPGRKPQTAINEVSAKTQMAMLESGPFGAWAKDVLG